MSENGRTNRLARESSPYLLLHARNPVDWYPWGEEAFEAARAEDKPIFLSVGYSTCYWCHVMERESFSNEKLAEQLNHDFVSIKLDREERPDLDEIYMTATQLLTRSGGWPNSVFLTAELKPFFAGTYFPPSDWHGRPGFPRVLRAIREAWDERRQSVLEQAEAVAAAVRQQLAPPEAEAERELDAEAVVMAARGALEQRFDRQWGGFSSAPKFPSPANLYFLLDLARRGDARAQEMLVTTLDAMARGGIHDQLAGGFHRYSTDALWLVPHFEKMLYDNAALAPLYAAAADFAPAMLGFERVARRTLDFVLRELTGPHGGFLSAIDAETDGHEGAYYTWTGEELRALLDADVHELLSQVFGFDGPPNFEGERYVLHLPQPLAERARALDLAEAELLRRLERGQNALLAARALRKRPLLDDKVLADWNGQMIAAMAAVGKRLQEPRYLEAARRAAEFVLDSHRDAGGVLLHSYRNGQAKVYAMLDDYAFLIQGLLALHEACGEGRWLSEAERLQAELERRLSDSAGGYFVSGEDPRLLFRSKAAHDGAMPSGNGIALQNLLALAERTSGFLHEQRAGRALQAFAQAIAENPLAHVTLVQAALVRLKELPSALLAARKAGPRRPAREEALQAVAVVPWLDAAENDGGWRRFALDLRIRDGWHLNANPSSRPYLIATEVQAREAALRNLRYPEAKAWQSAETLLIYEGAARIEGEVETRGRREAEVLLVYQPCDEERCLERVSRVVRLAAPAEA